MNRVDLYYDSYSNGSLKQKFHHPNLNVCIKNVKFAEPSLYGADNWVRTSDLRVISTLLYQLSYACKNFQNNFLFWVTGEQS